MYRLFVFVLSLCISSAAHAQPAAAPSMDDVFAAIRTLQAAPALHATASQPQPAYAPPPYPYPYYYPPQPPVALPPVDKQFVCVTPTEPAPEPLSDELKSAIKQKITSCWIPAYVEHAPEINLTLAFKEDGALDDAKLSDDQMAEYKSNMLFQSLVNSLRRAAFNPRCMPGKDLPKDAYDSWKEVALTFNVKDAPR